MSVVYAHPPTRVVVAMSGGVDSSVAALLVHEAQVEALGVSMQVWDYRNNGGCNSRATCCAPDDFTDARRVAASIGIPYYVFDFESTFKREVIDVFKATYAAGETPNPCVDCNAKVKFKELRERAKALGCSHVATGHYAQVREVDGIYYLERGVDREKDQSYFLYNLTQAELRETLFPVGHLTKPEVRARAEAAGLVTAQKPESQDICFVSGELSEFLVRVGVKKRPGTIVATDGSRLGTHDGVHQFTVGQRRGLHIGGQSNPLYVVRIEPSTNTVVVGEKHELERTGFAMRDLSWTAPEASQPREPFEALVQVRHRHAPVRVRVTPQSEVHRAEVTFLEEWATVTPGQAAVLYGLDNTTVLGGGRILRDAVAEGSLAGKV
jgi:tRNA-specific 2-thiouridylase